MCTAPVIPIPTSALATPKVKNTNDKKTAVLVPGEERSVILNPGDGLIYKGCERPHWRDVLPTPEKVEDAPTKYYYHQIFFHYVLQDGQRAHCAWDRAR